MLQEYQPLQLQLACHSPMKPAICTLVHIRLYAAELSLNLLGLQEDMLPGPAGILQRAQASGQQLPQLPNLLGHTRQTASQWQQQQNSMHPDFLSAAWQSAMEALDLPCFDGK